MLVNFKAIWYTYVLPFGIFYGCIFLCPFWYIFPVLVCFTKTNLATLMGIAMENADASLSANKSTSFSYSFHFLSRLAVRGEFSWRQGDQIGRIFAFWAILHFWAVFLEYRSNTNFGQLFFHGKNF
jgi:hypothetical protein